MIMLPPFSSDPRLDQVVETIEYTPEEWESFLRSFRYAENYQVWLQQQGVTAEEFEAWVKREFAIRKFQQRQWGRRVASYFLDRKRQLDRVVCSLIYVQDRNLAQELYFRLSAGEATFPELARVYSEGHEAGNGGKLGPIELGQLHPHLARLFYGAHPGQLWEPIAIDQGWVIARLEENLPVQFDEYMRQSLLNELLEVWLASHS